VSRYFDVSGCAGSEDSIELIHEVLHYELERAGTPRARGLELDQLVRLLALPGVTEIEEVLE